jgi:hypothetical protein
MKQYWLQLFRLFFISVPHKMAFLAISIFVVAIFFAASCSLNAQILSGSFEGDPNLLWDPNGPWDVNGLAPQIVSAFVATDKYLRQITIQSVNGSSFVLLKTGGGNSSTDFSEITQIVTVNAGDTISGVYFFSTIDWVPSWNDAANIYLSLYDPCSPGPNPPDSNSPEPKKDDHLYYGIEIPLAYHDVNTVAIYRSQRGGAMADWKRFFYTFQPGEEGTYRLVLRVADAIDEGYQSTLAVDALSITAGPPGPWCDFKPVGDINRDCKVDIVDFAMMAENWLINCNITPENQACISP